MKKTILMLVLTCFACTVFAETFQYYKYQQLAQKARETKTAADKKALNDYVLNSELSGDAKSDYIQLQKLIPIEFAKQKIVPTVQQIDAKVKEKFTAVDETGKIAIDLRAALYRFYRYPDALVALSKQAASVTDNVQTYEKSAINLYVNKKQYDKALQIALKYDGTEYSIANIYVKKKDKQNVWKYGKLAFENSYIPNANNALNLIKNMFNYKPTTVKDEQVVTFLKYLGDKYPTPGTDFETWKGFMGFVGYKYKTLTGNDLYKTTK